MASQIPITVRAQPVNGSAAALRGKKRPGSPAASAAPPATASSCSSSNSSNSGSKKKKGPLLTTTTAAHTQNPAVESAVVTEMKAVGSADSNQPPSTEPTAKPPPFKDPTFMHSGIGGAAAGKKNRTWKNLKQILALERTLPWKLSDPNYYSIDAPPSFKPSKKYSDISGLPANYTDPQTKLRFTSSEEFSYIRLLPTDVVTGYLALRKATCIVP
ncbi:INO80 complex subunit C [Nelusetta ayraudi]|uniref:INO80 complex subunit C n=1 Tax=Nelusetta ayraudi TaxID=303726 RepID=UPI003F6ED67D